MTARVAMRTWSISRVCSTTSTSDRDHAQLRLHHAEPVQRRPRRPVRRRRHGGARAAEVFLRSWVARDREASPAFRADGLLVITFDESGGLNGPASAACCGERRFPGPEYAAGLSGPGGGRIGAVLLSPFVKPGTVSEEPYNHYALLGTIEALFGLPRLGYAARRTLRSSARTSSAPAPPTPTRPRRHQ